MTWHISISLWAVAAAAGFAVAAVWFFATAVRREKPGGKLAIAAELLRLTALLLLAAAFLKPELVRSRTITGKPVVAILCDASRSMTTKDVVDNGVAVSRESWLAERKEAKFWAPLEKRYKTSVQDFAAYGAADSNAAPVDAGTDINAALETASRSIDGLSAVVLLSDGDWNAGHSPVSAATKLRMSGVPVFAVAIGSSTYLPDLEMRDVMAPAYALMDEHISLPFTIQSRLPRDARTTVSLVSHYGVETRKDVIVPAMSELQDFVILAPRQEGDVAYTLQIPAEKEEALEENNHVEFRINMRREKLKVLVVESAPRWEYRFIRNALMRDPGIESSYLLMHPGMDVATGTGYIPSFPATREELSTFDVVFLGDVGFQPGRFGEESAELLKALVEQQGSGLVFLPGMRGGQKAFAGSPLEEIMPVVMDPAGVEGVGSSLESHLVLTERGRGHLLTMLESDPVRNEALWRRLPGFYWYAGIVKAKAGADVLAVHSVARRAEGRIPLLVTKACGNGKVLFMGTDSAWRWRRGVEDTYHYRFWGQVVRWMAHQRHVAHDEGIRFFYTPESPSRGDRVFLHATVFDKAGYPVATGEVHVKVAAPDGRTEDITLTPEAGGWGVFTGTFAPSAGGTHNVEVSEKESGRLIKTRIAVGAAKIEKTGQPARLAVLKEIASVTGGKFGESSDLDSIIRDIVAMPESKATEERLRLWCHPVFGGLVVLLLALYWCGRKLMGLT